VRNLVPLAELLSRYGVLSQLKPSGSQLKGRCPIHDGSNPSQFTVNLTQGTWYCFGDCNTGGGTLEFVAARERVSLSRAAALIAEWFGLPPPFRNLQHRRPPMSTRSTHKVLAVTERPDGTGSKSYYTKIGVGFPIKNGAGLALQLDALPVSGRLIVLQMDDDDRASDAADRVEA
jgi:hypothetical protein